MLSRLVRLPFRKNSKFCLLQFNSISLRCISTSKKNSDVSTAAATDEQTCKPPVKKQWQSYGWDPENEESDRMHMHISFFLAVSMCIVWTSFYVAYAPNREDWEYREAFLRLRKREELGLPPVDPNYVDPSEIELPTDEELGDTEVII